MSLEGAVPSGQSRTDTPVSANPATTFVPISQSAARKQASGGAHRERSAVLNKHSLELTAAAGSLIERNGHLIWPWLGGAGSASAVAPLIEAKPIVRSTLPEYYRQLKWLGALQLSELHPEE